VNAPQLRPLGIGEVLDVAIKIYWRNARTLMFLVLFVVGPAQLLLNFVTVSATPEDEEDFLTTTETGEVEFDSTELGTLFAGLGAAAIISFLASTIATGAAFRAIAESYLGRKPEWRESLGYVLRRLHSVLWVTMLSALLVVLGFILCIAPGVYLLVAFTVAVPVLLTEGVKGRHALGRSRDLVRGRWWHTLAIVFLGALLVGIVAGAIQGLATVFVSTDAGSDPAIAVIVGTISGTLSAVITTPFQAAYTTVLYFDLRVRKEAFDLQLLAQQIGVEPPPGALAAEAPAPMQRHEDSEQPPYWPPPPGWKPRSARDAEE
jgi:hypothetical protein